MADMTSHGSVIRCGIRTTLSTDLPSIGLFVPPPPAAPHPFSTGRRISEHEAEEAPKIYWVCMHTKRQACIVLLRHLLWSLSCFHCKHMVRIV